VPCRGRDEISQGVCALFDISEIEHSLGEATEKARLAVLQDITPRAEQRGTGREFLSKWNQIILVAAGAVQEQQRRGGGIGSRLETMEVG
jgi:hypothetical protein